MSAIAEKLITAEDYLKLAPTDRPSELVRGKIVVMNPPQSAHGYWCGRMFWRLNDFVMKHQLGRVITNDGGVQTEHDPDTVRGADVAYYSYERVPRGPLPKGYWPAPELVVEVKSSDDRWKTIHKKVGEYLDAGVLTVIVVDPDKQLIHVTTPDRETETLTIDHTLTLPELLPGFSVPVKDVFET